MCSSLDFHRNLGEGSPAVLVALTQSKSACYVSCVVKACQNHQQSLLLPLLLNYSLFFHFQNILQQFYSLNPMQSTLH